MASLGMSTRAAAFSVVILAVVIIYLLKPDEFKSFINHLQPGGIQQGVSQDAKYHREKFVVNNTDIIDLFDTMLTNLKKGLENVEKSQVPKENMIVKNMLKSKTENDIKEVKDILTSAMKLNGSNLVEKSVDQLQTVLEYLKVRLKNVDEIRNTPAGLRNKMRLAIVHHIKQVDHKLNETMKFL